ncbi:hypothetical protein D3C75_501620 [compost metagenome]
MTTADPKFVTVSVWGRDLHTISFADRDNYELYEHQGYMPVGLQLGGGDETSLTIDVETGMIVGWDKEKFLEGYNQLRDMDDD